MQDQLLDIIELGTTLGLFLRGSALASCLPSYFDLGNSQENLLQVTKHYTSCRLRQMIDRRVITKLKTPCSKSTQEIPYSKDQISAINTLLSNIEQHQVYVLKGAPGAGKTDVYFKVIEQNWRLGGPQTLVAYNCPTSAVLVRISVG
ncbi:MAG: hypothetical protein GY787_24530 [Alteromonadales bacterium]|nr:hypothetical protein [Alteromonadales bacterium]